MSVHAKGLLSFSTGDELIKILKRTTSHFENNPHSPSLVEKMSSEYIDRMVIAIEAFEIEVIAIDHVFKLSQNRDEKSYHSIINKLQQSDEDSRQIAAEMEKRTSQLFKPGPKSS